MMLNKYPIAVETLMTETGTTPSSSMLVNVVGFDDCV
jgi:hypothetical protein